jgi:anti-anti-sigma factor
MTLHVTDYNGTPVVELKGRIKGEGDEKLQTTMNTVMASNPAKVIVDVSKADYIDSHGLGIIIYYHKIMQNDKRKLYVLNANPDPESYMGRLIEITNLDKVMNVVKSLKGV